MDVIRWLETNSDQQRPAAAVVSGQSTTNKYHHQQSYHCNGLADDWQVKGPRAIEALPPHASDYTGRVCDGQTSVSIEHHAFQLVGIMQKIKIKQLLDRGTKAHVLRRSSTSGRAHSGRANTTWTRPAVPSMSLVCFSDAHVVTIRLWLGRGGYRCTTAYCHKDVE